MGSRDHDILDWRAARSRHRVSQPLHDRRRAGNQIMGDDRGLGSAIVKDQYRGVELIPKSLGWTNMTGHRSTVGRRYVHLGDTRPEVRCNLEWQIVRPI